MITVSLSNAEVKSVFTPNLEIHFSSCRVLNSTKLNLYIFLSVFMLLDRIDVSKSSGPDKLPGRLLQSLAKEITPVVHFIFTQSLCPGKLPTEWTQANVATF